MKVADITLSPTAPVLIAGPCQIESREHALKMADSISACATEAGFPLIYKSSYDKANRTSINSPRGIGLEEGLDILDGIHKHVCPVVTDVHSVVEAHVVGNSMCVDALQIPALLSRQTDLLFAAGRTDLPVLIKKSPMAEPTTLVYAVEKVGHSNVAIVERGTFFGYGRLVVDFASFPILAGIAPLVFDATHSVQGAIGVSTGGDRTLSPLLARAAIAVGGVSGIFLEVHDDPDNAPSDGPVQTRLSDLPSLLAGIRRHLCPF